MENTNNTAIAQTPNMQILCEEWIQSRHMTFKRTTYSIYATILEAHIIPYWGILQPSQVTERELLTFVQYLFRQGRRDGNGGLKLSSISSIIGVLQQVLEYGRQQGYPCSAARAVSLPHSVQEATVLSRFEYQKLCSYLLTMRDNYAWGIRLCMYTGIRIGELCALQWNDINAEGILHIRKTVLRIRNTSLDKSAPKTQVIIGPPKTKSSMRRIPLPFFLQEEARTRQGAPDSYILTNSSKYMEPRLIQYHFKQILNRCGIRPYKFHSLRHTFATECVEAGVDYKTLSELLGHSSIKTTMAIYVHSSMELKQKSLERLVFRMQETIS